MGPPHWAQARLIRFADDFVILAKTIGPAVEDWVERTVEGWLGLTINRTKPASSSHRARKEW